MENNMICRKCGGEEFRNNGKKPSGGHRKQCLKCGAESVLEKFRTLIIPDLHFPFEHRNALEFCKQQYDRFKCNRVVQMGDQIDVHQVSRHTSEPDALGAIKEYELAKERIAEWSKVFPVMDIVLGNHDLIPQRQAKEVGLPSVYLRSLNEVYGMPDTWRWHKDLIIDDVLYLHNGGSGKYAAINKSREQAMSVVTAHTHKHGGVPWLTNPRKKWFGMNAGSLIDKKTYAMRYSDSECSLGCGVSLEGKEAFWIPMQFEEG